MQDVNEGISGAVLTMFVLILDATIVCDTLAGSMTFGAGRCVRSSNEKLNYGGAEQFCNDASLKLISSDDITNFQELPQIRYSKKSRRYFTGLKRLPTADPNEVLFGSEDGKYVVTSDNDILAKAEGSISDGDIVCLNDRGAITEICLGYHIIYALCAYKFWDKLKKPNWTKRTRNKKNNN